MSITTTLLYASLFALFGLVLSFRAGTFRARTGISLLYGEPQNLELAERVRAHQNFLEYVPIVLIVMGAAEASGGSPAFLHALGSLLLVARVAHVIGLRHDNMAHPGRIVGAGGTALITVLAAGYGIWIAARALAA